MKPFSQITVRTALAAGLLFGGCAFVGAQQSSDQDSATRSNAAQPDNTKVNRRDRNATDLTADRQKSNRSDREITQ